MRHPSLSQYNQKCVCVCGDVAINEKNNSLNRFESLKKLCNNLEFKRITTTSFE